LNLSTDDARIQFAKIDSEYESARLDLKLPAYLEEHMKKDSDADNLTKLAGALASYFDSSMLIAKYYSLGVVKDKTTNKITKIGKQKAFITMLTLAESMSREHAATALKLLGEVPLSAKIAYQIGRAYRDNPGTEDKLEALEQFWRSSMFSQLAVMLSLQKTN